MPKVHNPIGNKNKFICEPEPDYQKNCPKPDPPWEGKIKGAVAAFEYFKEVAVTDKEGNRVKDEKGQDTKKGQKVPWEAHHVLSISCVNNFDGLNDNQRKAVEDCCYVTDWNINNKDNFIALPLFGHTLKWYVINENTDPPGWKDLPQHDWDHNSTKGYCTDVRNDILEFYKTLQEAAEGHELTPRSIAENFKVKETKWKYKIRARGKGTHSAWGPPQLPGWYKPFSMASPANATFRPPLRIQNKIEKLRSLLNKWGGR